MITLAAKLQQTAPLVKIAHKDTYYQLTPAAFDP